MRCVTAVALLCAAHVSAARPAEVFPVKAVRRTGVARDADTKMPVQTLAVPARSCIVLRVGFDQREAFRLTMNVFADFPALYIASYNTREAPGELNGCWGALQEREDGSACRHCHALPIGFKYEQGCWPVEASRAPVQAAYIEVYNPTSEVGALRYKNAAIVEGADAADALDDISVVGTRSLIDLRISCAAHLIPEESEELSFVEWLALGILIAFAAAICCGLLGTGARTLHRRRKFARDLADGKVPRYLVQMEPSPGDYAPPDAPDDAPAAAAAAAPAPPPQPAARLEPADEDAGPPSASESPLQPPQAPCPINSILQLVVKGAGDAPVADRAIDALATLDPADNPRGLASLDVPSSNDDAPEEVAWVWESRA